MIEVAFKFTRVDPWVRIDISMKGNDPDAVKDKFCNSFKLFKIWLSKEFEGKKFYCENNTFVDIFMEPEEWLNLYVFWDRSDLNFHVLSEGLSKTDVERFEKWTGEVLKPLLLLLKEPNPWKKFAEEKTITITDESQPTLEIP
jgi:hypothetical protein